MLPFAWEVPLAAARITAQAIGASSADVFRVQCEDGSVCFLKSEHAGGFSELPGEVARLRWLEQQGVAAARVLDAREEGGRHWLLMTALSGVDLASSPALAPAHVVALVADALRCLHQIPVEACPFDQRLPLRLGVAAARVQAGLVDEEDFDDERIGQSAGQVLAALQATAPDTSDLVVTHGDACLPNLIAEKGRFSGFIDCGRAGVADRHQDLALAARSIADTLGEAWVQPFFAHYGIAPDPQRLAFYRLLDELF